MIVENPALSFFVALSVIGMGYLQWRDRHFWRGGEWRNDEATPHSEERTEALLEKHRRQQRKEE